MFAAKDYNNLKSDDRILVLKPMEGKDATRASTGDTDPRLFTGNNRLHIIMDPPTGFWYFKYDHGGLPGALSDRYTRYKQAFQVAEAYFKKRNVEIVEVID